jgi:hypothetical protein
MVVKPNRGSVFLVHILQSVGERGPRKAMKQRGIDSLPRWSRPCSAGRVLAFSRDSVCPALNTGERV